MTAPLISFIQVHCLSAGGEESLTVVVAVNPARRLPTGLPAAELASLFNKLRVQGLQCSRHTLTYLDKSTCPRLRQEWWRLASPSIQGPGIVAIDCPAEQRTGLSMVLDHQETFTAAPLINF